MAPGTATGAVYQVPRLCLSFPWESSLRPVAYPTHRPVGNGCPLSGGGDEAGRAFAGDLGAWYSHVTPAGHCPLWAQTMSGLGLQMRVLLDLLSGEAITSVPQVGRTGEAAPAGPLGQAPRSGMFCDSSWASLCPHRWQSWNRGRAGAGAGRGEGGGGESQRVPSSEKGVFLETQTFLGKTRPYLPAQPGTHLTAQCQGGQ